MLPFTTAKSLRIEVPISKKNTCYIRQISWNLKSKCDTVLSFTLHSKYKRSVAICILGVDIGPRQGHQFPRLHFSTGEDSGQKPHAVAIL